MGRNGREEGTQRAGKIEKNLIEKNVSEEFTSSKLKPRTRGKGDENI
jgi:hypothetical protein